MFLTNKVFTPCNTTVSFIIRLYFNTSEFSCFNAFIIVYKERFISNLVYSHYNHIPAII